jgi:hypothetical protein
LRQTDVKPWETWGYEEAASDEILAASAEEVGAATAGQSDHDEAEGVRSDVEAALTWNPSSGLSDLSN